MVPCVVTPEVGVQGPFSPPVSALLFLLHSIFPRLIFLRYACLLNKVCYYTSQIFAFIIFVENPSHSTLLGTNIQSFIFQQNEQCNMVMELSSHLRAALVLTTHMVRLILYHFNQFGRHRDPWHADRNFGFSRQPNWAWQFFFSVRLCWRPGKTAGVSDSAELQ